MPVKKIINNGVFIAELAPLINNPVAAKLGKVARAYSNIIDKFGITPAFDGFDGCEQARYLLRLITSITPDIVSDADEAKMAEWTNDILAAIDDMAHGHEPSTE